MQLSITSWSQSPQDDILLIAAESLTVNTSVRQFKYGCNSMDQTTPLTFLEQFTYWRKKHKEGVSSSNYHFLGDVEKCTQQIRCTRDISSLLKVKIVF